MNIISNELVPVYDNNGDHAVNTRDLHEFLEVGKDYSNWIKDRTGKLGLIEGEDYEIVSANSGENLGGRPGKDYIVSVDTAKEIAMMENSDKGREVRRYFIKVEKKFRHQAKPMSALDLMSIQLEIAREHESKINVLESKTQKLESKLEHMSDAMTSTSSELWNADMNQRINGLCQTYGLNYQTYRGDLYIKLESVARCNLSARKARLQERMGESGHKYKEVKAVTKLQVIADDPKLRAIFEGIVRTEQVKYANVPA